MRLSVSFLSTAATLLLGAFVSRSPKLGWLRAPGFVGQGLVLALGVCGDLAFGFGRGFGHSLANCTVEHVLWVRVSDDFFEFVLFLTPSAGFSTKAKYQCFFLRHCNRSFQTGGKGDVK